jgi:hemerythrin superfamily protein
MDIYAYIKRDHLKVADLMQQLLDIRLAAFHRRLFDQIKTELLLHTEAEERTFYKAIDAASREQATEEEMAHAVHDHGEIRDLLSELTDMSENNEMWMVRFGELKHAVEHHVMDEESNVWKKARMVLTADQERTLARDMDREKQRLLTEVVIPAQ